MRISEFAVRRPVTTCMINLALILLGYLSYKQLPVQLLPNLVFPQVGVWAQYTPGQGGGSSPAEMEEQLAIPIENIAASLPDVKKIQTSVWDSGCWVWVEMDFSTDMRFVFIELQERLELLKKNFPRNALHTGVVRFDTAEFQKVFMMLVITGPSGQSEIRAVALDQIQQRLEELPGISKVNIGGRSPDFIEVGVDENRLREHGVPFHQLSRSLQSWSSEDIYLGQLETRLINYYVRIAGRYENLFDLEQVPIEGKQTLRLADLADVRPSHVEENRESIYRFNGGEAIGIWLEKDAIANPIDTAHAVRNEIEKLKEFLPPGYDIMVRWDDAEFIEKVINGVTKLALIGMAIAMVVLLLFLRNLRAALIILAAIPVSIISTFNLMYFAGFSFNLFSLVGLAFGIGMLVDNSIVVLENIYRHFHLTRDRKLAALRGSHEVIRPIIASTLTTLIVFLPILFKSNFIQLIFKEMALSIVFPIVMSMFIAYTFVPMAAAGFLKMSEGPGLWSRWFGFMKWIPFYRIIHLIPRFYLHTLKRMLRYPLQTMLIVAFLILYAWSNWHRIQEGFIESDFNDDRLTFYVNLPTGSKTESTDQIVKEVEAIVKGLPGLKHYSTNIREDTGTVWLRLEEAEKRSFDREELFELILERTTDLPEANISRYPASEEAPSEFNLPSGGGSSIEIRGSHQDQLAYLSDILVNQLRRMPSILSAESDLSRGRPELRLLIDREKASLFQVSTMQIAQALQGLQKNGQYAEVNLRQGDEELQVFLEMDSDENRMIDDIRDLPVYTGAGQTVPLGDVCAFEITESPGGIRRENQERMTRVHYTIKQGRTLTQVQEEIGQLVKALRIPAGYTITVQESSREINEMQAGLMEIVRLGILLIFMVLASLFESFGAPFVVLLALPLAIIGGTYGLIIAKNPFDIFANMGVIVLVGIVVNNAILLLHFVTSKRRNEGWSRSRAVMTSCRSRFRPIWMTTLTTAVGLLPLAWKSSANSIWTPFAVVVIGGLLGSTLLTPYVIPAMYLALENVWLAWKKRLFRLLSWRWILLFWNKKQRQQWHTHCRERFIKEFGQTRLSRHTLASLPLKIEVRNLTMVYPEKKTGTKEALKNSLHQFKTEVLLPSPQMGIVPASFRSTEEGADPRSSRFGFKALDRVNLEIGPGLFGLLGPNGAGKTTLIRILSAAAPPSRGQVLIGGHDIKSRRRDLAKIVGYLPQTFGFYDDFSPLAYLNLMAIQKGVHRPAERKKGIEQLLRKVNLWQERRTPIGRFSGGMRQRLGIAQTLLTLPRIIIVDEPTAGLDPRERVNFRNMLSEIGRDRIVIISSHIIEDIASGCRNVGILDQGRILYSGGRDELINQAKGRLWVYSGPAETVEKIEKDYSVVSRHVVTGGKRIRFFSETRPPFEAEPVEATLEDAYIYVRRHTPAAEVQ
jgi:hydrophobic/amphiphilic exporter-1 (mainly G- bacteria), HAE1 family